MHESNWRYEGWRVATAGGVGVFLASLIVYTFGVLLKPLSEEFSWSREAVSAAYGVTAMVTAIAAAPFGYLLDRFRPTLIIVASLIVLACGYVSLSMLTPKLWHLYVIFAVLGLAALGTSALAYSRAVASWFDRRRGMALALVVSGGAIGGIVHPPIAEVLTRLFDWRGAALAFAGMFVLIGLPTVIALVRERETAIDAANQSTASSTVTEGLVSRVFWFQWSVLFCSAIAQNAAIVHLAPLLTDRGVSASEAAMAMSAMGAASLGGRLVTGWLLDRFFAPYVSFALLAIAAMGTFLLADAQSFAVGAFAGMCIGFGMGGESDVTPYLLSRYFGLSPLSTLYGFTWVATGIGGAVGPILAGRAFDSTGSYDVVMLRLSILTLAAAALMFGMPRYRRFGEHPLDSPVRAS